MSEMDGPRSEMPIKVEQTFVGIHFTEEGIAVAIATLKADTIDSMEAFVLESGSELKTDQQALNSFVFDHHLQGAACCVVLKNSDYSLTMIDAPNVPEEELAGAVRWSLKDIISTSLDTATIEAFTIPLPRARDNVKLAYAIVCQNAVIEKIKLMVETAGLRLEAVDIPELVLRDLFCLDPNSAKGFVGLWLQPVGGELLLCYESMVYIARRLEFDNKCLIKKKDEAQTEKAEDAVSRDAILENLAIEIYRSQDYVNTTFKPKIEKNIVIIGPSLLKNIDIQQALKEYLSQEVYVLNLMQLLPFKNDLSLEVEANAFMAIGATLRYGGKS